MQETDIKAISVRPMTNGNQAATVSFTKEVAEEFINFINHNRVVVMQSKEKSADHQMLQMATVWKSI